MTRYIHLWYDYYGTITYITDYFTKVGSNIYNIIWKYEYLISES